MDRARRRPARLIALAALGAIAAAPPPAAPPLRAMRWLAPGADAARVLTRAPTECLGPAASAADAQAIALGRAAFRTPLLLGGQGGRAGLSCESCHRSGRGNPDFDFPGVSGAPGTADVTTAILSSHEAAAVHGPRPIPDLSGPKSALKIPQDRGSRALEAAIDRIITREFDGPEPPPAVLSGLADYVRALSPVACPAAREAPMTAEADLADARLAVEAGARALGGGDAAAAAVALEAARSILGDVDERYASPSLAPLRLQLQAASRALGDAAAEIRRGEPRAAGELTIWLAREPAWAAAVAAWASLSLYDPGRLAAAAAEVQATGRPPSSTLN